jgi:hypothetical protein
MWENMGYLFFSVWLISLSVMHTSSTLQTTQFHSSLRLNNTLLCICATFSLPFISGWLPCWLHGLALVKGAAVNVGVQVSPLHGDLYSFGGFIFSFLRNLDPDFLSKSFLFKTVVVLRVG